MKDINVAVVTDDNAAMQLSVTLKSLLINKKENERIHIYYVETGLTCKHKEYIAQMVTNCNCEITFIEAPQEYLDIVKEARIKIVYCYCFLHEILPNTLDKVLMIESDMIVLDSVSNLYSINIDDYCLAAIDDMQSKWYKEKIGINSKSLYFNSGVMLLNLERIRKKKITEKTKEVLKSGNYLCSFDVQDELNYLYEGEVKSIPPKYNFTSSFVPYNYSDMQKYRIPSTMCSEEEYMEAREMPTIVHFTRSQLIQPKPWFKPCNHPYKDEWIKYRNMTILRDEPLKSANMTLKRRVINICYRYLPKRMSATMLGIFRAYFYPKFLYRILKHN